MFAVEEAGKAVSAESWAQCQQAVAHPAFLERRGLWVGGWDKEISSSIRAKSSLTLSGESPAGIPHCEELAQVTLRASAPVAPLPPLLPSLSWCFQDWTPPAWPGRAPTWTRGSPPAGEPSSMKSWPPQKLPEAPVPTIPVPGCAPGQKELSVERPG